jgi:hypothetical protein
MILYLNELIEPSGKASESVPLSPVVPKLHWSPAPAGLPSESSHMSPPPTCCQIELSAAGPPLTVARSRSTPPALPSWPLPSPLSPDRDVRHRPPPLCPLPVARTGCSPPATPPRPPTAGTLYCIAQSLYFPLPSLCFTRHCRHPVPEEQHPTLPIRTSPCSIFFPPPCCPRTPPPPREVSYQCKNLTVLLSHPFSAHRAQTSFLFSPWHRFPCTIKMQKRLVSRMTSCIPTAPFRFCFPIEGQRTSPDIRNQPQRSDRQ